MTNEKKPLKLIYDADMLEYLLDLPDDVHVAGVEVDDEGFFVFDLVGNTPDHIERAGAVYSPTETGAWHWQGYGHPPEYFDNPSEG